MPPEAPPSPAKIDPTPRQGDITSFEQAKSKSPARRAEQELQGDTDEAPDPVRTSMRENAKPPRPFDFKRKETPVKSNNPPEKKKVEAKKPEPKKEEKKADLDDEDFSPAKDPDPSGFKKKQKDDKQIERDLEDYADAERPGGEPEEDEEDQEGENDEKPSDEEQKEEPGEEEEEKAIESDQRR